ncbi:uncharacterized protein LOC134204590 [Armigeres subalbatus]|uniref:uncharacterized protein LOC134204590 n=1 Tax=Armigeres subalbatus TaxID=124917 RepID=UPI002ED21DBD
MIVTHHTEHFFFASDIPEDVHMQRGADEWSSWGGCGDSVLHIELGKWADLKLVAPLNANTLTKMAYGLSNNLLLCTARAGGFGKPLFFAPATNHIQQSWSRSQSKAAGKCVQVLLASMSLRKANKL